MLQSRLWYSTNFNIVYTSIIIISYTKMWSFEIVEAINKLIGVQI